MNDEYIELQDEGTPYVSPAQKKAQENEAAKRNASVVFPDGSYIINNDMNMDFSGIIDALQQQQMYSAQQANEMFDKQQKLIQDSVAANNQFAAEQAQQQMDFQSRETEAQRAFNASQAAIDREFQQQSANEAMAFSSAEAKANRDWQEYMSSTAHQREMADLQAAGLNPILAANNGASMGAGAVANSSAAAGSRASSVNAPSGAKANGDQSGTMALVSVLGKMLDNSTEIQKMIMSAETARATAELYTGATRYAAELAAAANRYGSDMQREIAGLNPWNILGEQIGDVLGVLEDNGISPSNGASWLAPRIINSAATVGTSKIADLIGHLTNKIGETWKGANSGTKKGGTTIGGKGGSHYVGKF